MKFAGFFVEANVFYNGDVGDGRDVGDGHFFSLSGGVLPIITYPSKHTVWINTQFRGPADALAGRCSHRLGFLASHYPETV